MLGATLVAVAQYDTACSSCGAVSQIAQINTYRILIVETAHDLGGPEVRLLFHVLATL